MNKNTSKEILNKLNALILNPVCELEFNNIFELSIAVVLSAQTTDKRVNLVTKDLFSRYPNPQSLAQADQSTVEGIILSLGLAKAKSKNIIALAKAINDNNDIIPNTLEELMKLPGVGRKTASVILAVGFNIPAMPIDTHVHRVAIRLGYISKDKNVLEAEEALKKYIPKEEWAKAHHLLLLFGRYYCQAKNPSCLDCPLKEYCKR